MIVKQKEIQASQQWGKTYSISESEGQVPSRKSTYITKKKMNTVPSPLDSSPRFFYSALAFDLHFESKSVSII